MSEATTKSSKLQTAIDKARGTTPEPEVISQVPPGLESMVRSFGHPDEIATAFAADMASGEFEAAPQLLSLTEGQWIEGFIEGNGPMAEFTRTDRNTGEVTVTEVKTWIIVDKSRSVRVSILSSAQLDRKLIGFIGSYVKIARGRDKNIGDGKRMTEYIVWGPRLKDGARRKWYDAPVLPAGFQHALPAEAGNHGHA